MASVGKSRQLSFVPDDSRHRKLAGSYDTTIATSPAEYDNSAYVWEGIAGTDQPIFWYIGKSGGATFSSIIAKCLGVTQASPKGDSTGKVIPMAPPVITVTHDDDQGKYLNVNPVNAAGIAQMVAEGVVASNQADIIITPRVTDAASSLTSAQNKGRFMVMMRHPVKREIDMFYYRQAATWDPNFDAQLATMSINDYVDSDKMLDNFMIRSLLNIDQHATITAEHVATAKNLLRQKFMVGIFEWYDASIARFEKYVGWWSQFNVETDATVNQCHYDEVKAHNHDAGYNPDVPAGGTTWNKFIIRSWADVELYTYAKHLYSEQTQIFS